MTQPLARILVVDDDDVDREKFRRLAVRGGLEVEITDAVSGAEALRLTGETQFDVIVVDYRLGDTTGIDLIRAIKERDERPLPIIMVTGLGDERIAVSAIREGVHEYLTKATLTAAEVAQTVASALRRVELERKVAEANAAREMAEHRLSQSRQQLDDARQMALLGSIYVDLESGQEVWSDEIFRLLGLEPGSCAPSRDLVLQKVHPDDLESMRNASNNFRSAFEPLSHENRLCLDDGTVRHVVVSGRVIHDARNVPRTLVLLIQDVTALRTAEIAASEREAQIQSLFDASSTGVLLAGTNGSVLRVNPGMCRLSGYSERELAALRWTDLVRPAGGPESGPDPGTPFDAQAEVHDAERLLRHKDGSSIWVSIDTSPVRSAGNAVTAVAVFIKDTGDRRHAQMLLQESERRFRTLVTGVPIGIFENDVRGACTFVNEAWTQISGWPARDVVEHDGCLCGILCVHPDDRAQVLAEWERVTLERCDHAFEFRFVSPDGRVVWVSCSIRATTDNAGAVTGYLGTVTDITERKSQQASLLAAKDAAEAASRAKADFLARMSHEIRTPMNSVIGMTDLTLQTELSDEQRDFLGMANSAAKGLLHLINDILDFSRAEAKALSLEHVSLDILACVESTVGRMQHRAKEKGLALRVALSAAVPRFVIGDPHRLTQILSNLLSNAVKFTEKGEVAVSLDAEASSDGRCALHFSVSDTGIGIPGDKQSVIFEPFGQADETVSRRFGGTGLGLAICVQLIELMQGRLWLESEEGHGSSFHFTVELPFVSAREGPTAGLVHGWKAIVVDGNHRSRRVLSEELSTWKMSVISVASVSAARQAIEESHPVPLNLVIVDEVTTRGAGLFASELANSEGPLVIVCCDPSPRMLGRPVANARLARVLRPVVPADLLAALQSLLTPSQAAGPTEQHGERSPASGAPRRILVAEDNYMNQRLIQSMLSRAGHRVSIVGDGRAALERLEAEEFDLVLMDVQMPGMSGLDAVEQLRAREARGTRHVPVVALTAQAMSGDAERCLKAGMDGYVAKPVDFIELEHVMAQALSAVAAVPSPPAESHEPYDQALLARRTGGDPGLLAELCRLFEDRAGVLLFQLQNNLDTHDHELLTSGAHELKGMLLNLTATHAGRIARELEDAGKAAQHEEAAACLARLVVEVPRLLSAMRAPTQSSLPPA
jgi:two-component system, sensor histidine kinase and response regulator